jgi:hypothetical protein
LAAGSGLDVQPLSTGSQGLCSFEPAVSAGVMERAPHLAARDWAIRAVCRLEDVASTCLIARVEASWSVSKDTSAATSQRYVSTRCRRRGSSEMSLVACPTWERSSRCPSCRVRPMYTCPQWCQNGSIHFRSRTTQTVRPFIAFHRVRKTR